MRRLQIVTAGVDLMARWFQGRGVPVPAAAIRIAAGLEQRHHARVNSEDVKEAMVALLEATGRPVDARRILVFDCRPFSDPAAGRSTRGHIGSSLGILRSVRAHGAFPGWWQEACRRVAAALGPGPGPGLTVVFFCRKGRHRSVAAAFLLSHLFYEGRAATGTRYAVDVFHAMRDFWMLGTCDERRACREYTAEKAAEVQQARSLLAVPFPPP